MMLDSLLYFVENVFLFEHAGELLIIILEEKKAEPRLTYLHTYKIKQILFVYIAKKYQL
jgi:hypothetical protein